MASDNTNASPIKNGNFESLVQKAFGGKMQTTYECSNCKSVSLHKECFTDLHLAFPEKSKTVKDHLTMQTLLNNYLTSENLDGENQYHCDHCASLQDAVKTMKIFEAPKFLTTTLMRFHYDRTQNRKTKVFTDIQYELDLRLPVFPNVDENNSVDQLYSLYAIVVHSGYSSDGGHYYTYAREPMTSMEASSEADLETYNKESSWYVFNDSHVSLSSFESFKNVFRRFPRDTAYVLFYQKINLQQPQSEAEKEATTVGTLSSSTTSKLNSEVKLIVEKDNVKFMREKERNSSSSAASNTKSMSSWPRNNDGDGDSNGSSGSRGCGGNSFNSPGRFVC